MADDPGYGVIGAQAGDIARRVTADVFTMVLGGALTGLALGIGAIHRDTDVSGHFESMETA